MREAMSQRTHFDLPGGRIEARVNLPKGRPTILLCHGYPGTNLNVDTAVALHEIGFGTVVWRYRGVEDQPGTYGFRQNEKDIIDLAGVLREAGLAPFGLGILGFSMGGFFASRALVSRPDLADFLVLMAPMTTLQGLPFDIEGFFRDGGGLIGGDAEARVKEAMSYREGEEPVALAAHIRAPTLVIHGSRDEIVPPDHSERFAGVLRAPSDLVTLPTDHSFAGQHGAVARAIDHFVESRNLALKPS